MAVVVSSYTTDVPFSALNRLMLLLAGCVEVWNEDMAQLCQEVEEPQVPGMLLELRLEPPDIR